MNLRGMIDIARPSHWLKNVFLVPGIVLAIFFCSVPVDGTFWINLLLGVASACLVASSNYVINEILDAPKDRFHPDKKHRPIPSGEVGIGIAYVEWTVLSAAGLAVAALVNTPFFVSALLLWIMGLLYNIPPIRLKDRPYLDVLSESVNNPIRLAMGWYAVGGTLMPTLSAIMAYWMFGAFLMAVKRFAEYRHIGDPERAQNYRKSFGYYTEQRLLISILYYAALFGMFSGVFIARYRLEVVLATPLVAYAMAYYLHMGHKPNSPVQYPESLHRQPKLMLLVSASFVVCALLLFLDLRGFESAFRPDFAPHPADVNLPLGQ